MRPTRERRTWPANRRIGKERRKGPPDRRRYLPGGRPLTTGGEGWLFHGAKAIPPEELKELKEKWKNLEKKMKKRLKKK